MVIRPLTRLLLLLFCQKPQQFLQDPAPDDKTNFFAETLQFFLVMPCYLGLPVTGQQPSGRPRLLKLFYHRKMPMPPV